MKRNRLISTVIIVIAIAVILAGILSLDCTTIRTAATTQITQTIEPTETIAGITDEEEWYYKLLCALTSPSLQHVKIGNFSFIPTEPVYSAWRQLVRYGGLTVNYVDVVWAPEVFNMVSRHESSEGAITGIGSPSSFWYVNESDVEAISDARDLWYKRLKWMLSTKPTRLYVENIPAGGNLGTASITLGDNGSIVRNIVTSSYQAGIRWTINGDTGFFDGTNFRGVYRVSGADYDHHWVNGLLYLPLNASVDGNSISWDLALYSSNPTLGYTSFAMIEVYDIPSWWMGD